MLVLYDEGGAVHAALWLSEWTVALLADAHPCALRIGLPSYDDDKPWHRPDAETLSAAADGAVAGVGDATGAGMLDGFALYASWSMDEAEWAQFDIRLRGTDPTDVTTFDPAP